MWAWVWASVAIGGDLPAGETSLEVEVVGALAEVTIRREFRNPLDRPIDAELWIPVPPGGAVDHMTLQVGERRITSVVEHWDRARATWEVAADQGRIAGLLEEQGEGRLRQRVANVPAGAEVALELRLAVPVERRAGAWELTLPLTSAPRFVVDGVDEVPFTDRAPSDALSVDFRVHAGLPISWLESPSHHAVATPGGRDAWLQLSGLAADRDLTVRWSIAGIEPQVVAFGAGGHGLLLIEPPSDELPPTPAPQDLVLLVDTSDSMTGPLRAQAEDLVERALDALGPEDRFTLLTFDDRVRGAAVRAGMDALSRASALAAFRSLPIGGGSALPDALRMALAVPAPPDRPLTVLVITDAAIADPVPVIAAVQGRRATVHVAALGAAPNHWLCDNLAANGGGVCVALGADAEGDAAKPIFDALLGPLLTRLEVDWPGAELPPGVLPDLHAGQALRLPVRGELGAEVVVRGSLAGQPWTQVAVVGPAPERLLALTWVRDRLDRAIASGDSKSLTAVANLAVEYQVVSPFTSLVGVDSEVTNPGGEVIPLQMALVGPAPPPVYKAAYTHGASGSYSSEIVVTAGVQAVEVDDPTVRRGGTEGARTERATPVVPIALGGLSDAGVTLDGLPLSDPLSVVAGARLARGSAYRTEDLGAGRALGGGGAERRVVMDRWLTNTPQAGGTLAGWVAGLPPPGASGEAGIGGRLARDHAWAGGRVAGDTRSLLGFDTTTWAADAAVRVQPGPEHRFLVAGFADGGLAEVDGAEARWGGGGGAVSWDAAGPGASLVTRAFATTRDWGEARADHLGLESTFEAWRPQLGLGAVAHRTSWSRGPDALATTWLALRPSLAGRLRSGFRADAGVEAGGLLGPDGATALASPKLVLGWSPGDERARVGVGVERRRDVARALPAPISPEVPTDDTAWLDLQAEPVRDLAIGLVGALVRQRFAFVASPLITSLPTSPVDPEQRDLRRLEAFVRKVPARRWSLEARWTWTGGGDRSRVADPAAPWVPGYLAPLRPHQLALAAEWDLPTDPFTQHLAGSIGWASAVPGASPHTAAPWLAPSWIWSVGAGQEIPVRSGSARVDLGFSGAGNAPGAGLLPLEASVLLDRVVLEPPWRFEGAIGARF